MASIAVRVRMRGPTVNRSAGQDAAMRSRLQDTAPFRLPQNLLATFLLSVCPTGCSSSDSVAAAASSMAFASSTFGEVDMAQLTAIPSKQSTTGLR